MKLVDALKRELTYDGHKNDLKELEQAHFNGGSVRFDRIRHRVRAKEKMSKGDRSHPNLVRLDKLIGNVTYDAGAMTCELQKRSTWIVRRILILC